MYEYIPPRPMIIYFPPESTLITTGHVSIDYEGPVFS